VSTSLRGIAVGDAEARLSEEPGARKPHAGICAGGRGVTPFPTATAAQSLKRRMLWQAVNPKNSHDETFSS